MLPEAVNYVMSEEDTTLEMFDTVANLTLTSYPDTPILHALAQLTEGLKECSVKVTTVTWLGADGNGLAWGTVAQLGTSGGTRLRS